LISKEKAFWLIKSQEAFVRFYDLGLFSRKAGIRESRKKRNSPRERNPHNLLVSSFPALLLNKIKQLDY